MNDADEWRPALYLSGGYDDGAMTKAEAASDLADMPALRPVCPCWVFVDLCPTHKHLVAS